MTKRLSMGRHYDNTIGLRISPPGQSVDGGRLTFSSDFRFAQTIFTLQAAMSVTQTIETISFPGQPSYNIYNVNGYVYMPFPFQLSFRPYCQMSHYYYEDGPGVQYLVGRPVGIVAQYSSTESGVEMFFNKRTSGDTHISGMIAGALVTNMPIDGAS